MSIIISGHSDDLIEIEGDITEEFVLINVDYIALSNGCMFKVVYDGCWRITPVVLRAGVVWSKTEAVDAGDIYSDRVTVEGDISWVAHCIRYAS
jgi:hypothetical protein